VGFFDSIASHSVPGLLYGAFKGGASAPGLPRFPTFDPFRDAQLAQSALEHQQAITRSAYSFSDLILAGGKPAAYKSPLGG
jgi:hypothetical protein